MQPRPLPSVIDPSGLIQNCAVDRLWSPIRFCPSLSWPTVPEAPPEAVRWKQQLVVRPVRAWVLAAKAAKVAKRLFMILNNIGLGSWK